MYSYEQRFDMMSSMRGRRGHGMAGSSMRTPDARAGDRVVLLRRDDGSWQLAIVDEEGE